MESRKTQWSYCSQHAKELLQEQQQKEWAQTAATTQPAKHCDAYKQQRKRVRQHMFHLCCSSRVCVSLCSPPFTPSVFVLLLLLHLSSTV